MGKRRSNLSKRRSNLSKRRSNLSKRINMSGGSSGWGLSNCSEQINTINKLQYINSKQSNTINTLNRANKELTVAYNYLNYIIQNVDDVALKNIKAILVKAAAPNAKSYIINMTEKIGIPGPSGDEATEINSKEVMYIRAYEEYINEIRNSRPHIEPDKLNTVE